MKLERSWSENNSQHWEKTRRKKEESFEPQITVRTMLPADAPAVAAIEKTSFSLPWSEKGFLDALNMENTICLTAERQKEVVGYCVLYCAADEGNVATIAVHPRFRQQGIANLLVSRAKQEAKKRRIVSIYLEVRLSNLPARKLYEKHGFVTAGVRRNFYEQPREDALVMVYSG